MIPRRRRPVTRDVAALGTLGWFRQQSSRARLVFRGAAHLDGRGLSLSDLDVVHERVGQQEGIMGGDHGS